MIEHNDKPYDFEFEIMDSSSHEPMINDKVRCFVEVEGIITEESLPTDYDEEGNGLDYENQKVLIIMTKKAMLNQCERVIVLGNVCAVGDNTFA